MRLPLRIALAAGILTCATTAQAQMRYQAMDTNNDHVITRNEWRGSDRAFRNQDWNGDGVLSGDEVRRGARRQSWSQDWNRDGRVDNVDAQIAQRFRGYDMNGDNRVARSEWPGDARLFTRLDTTRDGYLTVQEYTRGGGFMLDAQGGPSFSFPNIDANRDSWITRDEWNMGGADFTRLDSNRDDRISRFEFERDTAAYGANRYRYTPEQFHTFDLNRDGWVTRPESRMTTIEFDRFDANRDNRISRFEFDTVATVSAPSSNDRFATVDVNNDGSLTRSEWRGTEAGFTRLDANRDNHLSRAEYDAQVSNEPARSAAWRTGYDRGIQEGRAAGREDYTRRQGWDLDGQRELERADSGYTPQVGTLSDYQAGYREGFRNAYRAGFIEAGGRPPD